MYVFSPFYLKLSEIIRIFAKETPKKMMKRIVLFIMLLSISQSILAEDKSHKLLVNGRTWNYMTYYYTNEEPDTVYGSMTIDGPYEFDGRQCYKFSNVSLEEATNFFYEQDGKVYFYDMMVKNHNYYYAWTLDFNFNLNAGEDGVISVDTILVNNEYYRRLNFSRDVWIEGIGSLESALFSTWGEVPGTFMGSEVISVYDGDKCIFTTDNFRQPAVSTTGLQGVMSQQKIGVLYDLQGRRVQNKPRKGLYIQNGQKFVIK